MDWKKINEENMWIIGKNDSKKETTLDVTVGLAWIVIHACVSGKRKNKGCCANRLSADHWQFDCSGE